LNIRQALARDYTRIETREELIPTHWTDISNPSWMNMDFWEAYSGKN